MADKKGTFIIDNKIFNQEKQDEIEDRFKGYFETFKEEISNRAVIINKRQDFFEGRHHKWTNVQGERSKAQEGHILVVLNYIHRFATKLHQSLTNTPFRIKIKPNDESDEIETARAEAVEKAINKVFKDNKFYSVILKRAALNQIRDGDFAITCTVQEDEESGKHIEISPIEDLLKLIVAWDDAAGTSFSFTAFADMWTLGKIKREFGVDVPAFTPTEVDKNNQDKGDHWTDQYGLFANTGNFLSSVPTGANKLPKAEVINVWSYEVIKGKVKVVNMIFLNRELKQLIQTDYKKIPEFIGHSFASPGKPWSVSFIDDLIDAQVELNDRSGEEGDLIRIGSHMKFVVVNMPDFDADSVKVGSGQVIFIEGEGADFKPLPMTITPFPSSEYLNRMLDHMFNLGLPKIALSAGTLPYTGRVGATAYQPFIDLVQDLRVQWEVVAEDLVKMIQQYFIDYFPELLPIMTEHETDDTTGQGTDGNPVVREVEFEWDNVLPLSRSDKVVDASTLRDRGAISLSTYLGQAGFADPDEEVKKLKKESKDSELMTIRQQFAQFSPGVVNAQIGATRAQEEAQAETQAQIAGAQAASTPTTPPTPSAPPILNSDTSRRGVPSSGGTPSGQTSSLAGDVAQKSQNANAKAGV